MNKIDDLKKIKKLLDEGLISQDEFESLKANIIGDKDLKSDIVEKTVIAPVTTNRVLYSNEKECLNCKISLPINSKKCGFCNYDFISGQVVEENFDNSIESTESLDIPKNNNYLILKVLGIIVLLIGCVWLFISFHGSHNSVQNETGNTIIDSTNKTNNDSLNINIKTEKSIDELNAEILNKYVDGNFIVETYMDNPIRYHDNGLISSINLITKETNNEYSIYNHSTHKKDISFFKNGQLHSVHESIGQNLHGEQLSYWENGNLFSFEKYNNGIKEGEKIIYYSSGKVHLKWSYKDGKPDGFEQYLENGKIDSQSNNSENMNSENNSNSKITESNNSKYLSDIDESDNKTYNTTELHVKPDFPGGIEKFYKYISNNYQIPEVEDLHGKIYVTFVIEKDGSINDIKVIRDIGYGTGKEAVRILKTSPRWIPGESNGKKVRVLYSLPISL